MLYWQSLSTVLGNWWSDANSSGNIFLDDSDIPLMPFYSTFYGLTIDCVNTAVDMNDNLILYIRVQDNCRTVGYVLYLNFWCNLFLTVETPGLSPGASKVPRKLSWWVSTMKSNQSIWVPTSCPGLIARAVTLPIRDSTPTRVTRDPTVTLRARCCEKWCQLDQMSKIVIKIFRKQCLHHRVQGLIIYIDETILAT